MNITMIYLDSATWNNLLPWIQKGKLPFLKKIYEKGCHSTLKSTIPANTFTASPCMATGKTVGKTGIISTSINGKPIRYKDIPHKSFWDCLGEENIESFIAGLGMTYKPDIKKGMMVTGELMYPHSNSPDISYPDTGFFKEYHKYMEEIEELQTEAKKENAKKLYELYKKTLKNQYQLFKEYLLRHEPDFKLFRIGVLDEAQHFLWFNQKYILLLYKEIDRIVEDLFLALPEDNFIIFSDHGAEAKPRKIFYINTWLLQKNYLKTLGGKFFLPFITIGQTFMERVFSLEFLGKIMRLIRKPREKNLKKDISDEYTLEIPGINWNKTKAYLSFPWGINIINENVDNPEKMKNDLVQEMKLLKNQGFLREVYKTENIYKGSKLEKLPDIIFVLNGKKYACVRPNFTFQLEGDLKKRDFKMWGYHDFCREGIFLACGPNITKTGKLREQPNIWDLAPTVLKYYGVDIPNDMDGKLIKILEK